MDLQSKNKEYQLMINSMKGTIKVYVPNSSTLICYDSWDYQTDLKKTVLKTDREVKSISPLVKVEVIDLSPVTSKKIWKVTVLRQPESELKHDTNSRKR